MLLISTLPVKDSHQIRSRDECFTKSREEIEKEALEIQGFTTAMMSMEDGQFLDPVPGFMSGVDGLISELLNGVQNFKDWEKKFGLTPKM